MYVLRLGFLDGKHGLVLSWLAAFSVFTKYARLWEMSLKDSSEETEKSRAESGPSAMNVQPESSRGKS
jgi:(heptosyl)LPS beta-1,4-glucosyltransferase